jgi:hypothetical protein
MKKVICYPPPPFLYFSVKHTLYTIPVDSQLYYPEIKLSKYMDAKDIPMFNDWLGTPLYLCTLQTRPYDTKCLPYFFLLLSRDEKLETGFGTCIIGIYS